MQQHHCIASLYMLILVWDFQAMTLALFYSESFELEIQSKDQESITDEDCHWDNLENYWILGMTHTDVVEDGLIQPL